MKKPASCFIYLVLFVVAFNGYRCQKDAGGSAGQLDPSDQYIKYTIAGITQNFLTPADSFRTVRQNSTTIIFAHPNNFTDSASWQYTSFNFTGATAPGTYTLSPSTFIVTKGIWPQSNIQYNDGGTITITITEFGNTGEYIAGTFTGPLKAWSNNAIVTGSCEFRVKRTF
jgi:hypothetical protein